MFVRHRLSLGFRCEIAIVCIGLVVGVVVVVHSTCETMGRLCCTHGGCSRYTRTQSVGMLRETRSCHSNSNWIGTSCVQNVSSALNFRAFDMNSMNFRWKNMPSICAQPARTECRYHFLFEVTTHIVTALRRHFVCLCVCSVWRTQDDSIDCQLNNYASDNVSFVCRIIILKIK